MEKEGGVGGWQTRSKEKHKGLVTMEKHNVKMWHSTSFSSLVTSPWKPQTLSKGHGNIIRTNICITKSWHDRNVPPKYRWSHKHIVDFKWNTNMLVWQKKDKPVARRRGQVPHSGDDGDVQRQSHTHTHTHDGIKQTWHYLWLHASWANMRHKHKQTNTTFSLILKLILPEKNI